MFLQALEFLFDCCTAVVRDVYAVCVVFGGVGDGKFVGLSARSSVEQLATLLLK